MKVSVVPNERGAPAVHNPTMKKRIVFLVPGFFGFSSVGAVNYFEDVERALGAALRRRGVEARIVRCATQPTASIPRRADVLRRQVIRSGGLRAARAALRRPFDRRPRRAHAADARREDRERRLGGAHRPPDENAISVATPHHGTPLANHFVTVQGQTLLLVLSALATSGQGRGTILAAAKAIALVARLDDWLGRAEGPLDRIAESLLRKIRFDRRDPGVDVPRRDRARPGRGAAAHARGDRSVRCRRGGPRRDRLRLRRRRRAEAARAFRLKELLDPEYVVLRALFRLLHALTARPHPRYPYPEADPDEHSASSIAGWASRRPARSATASCRR